MANPLPPLLFNPARLRSYILRLPLFTRAVLLFIAVFWVLEIQTLWSVTQWGALIPSETGLSSMYRLNTYPIIHNGLFHAFWNLLALTPLLERFEAEHGTLTSVALFVGPLSTLPAGLYLFVEKVILRGNTAVLGSSVWIFLLLGIEAIKTFQMNPHFVLGSYRIPTWTTPLFLIVIVFALVPNTSLLGHLCGVSVGYVFGLGYLKFLVPPEKILRWIEGKLNLLGRLPHYVSVDQKTFGRYGILPTRGVTSDESTVGMNIPLGSTQPNLVFKLRRDPRLLYKLPPYLSALLVIVGVVWLFLLPLNEYSRQTYISENALLPGQVHTYFAGSEQNIFRGFRREIDTVKNAEYDVISQKIQSIFRESGLKVATQDYEYHSAGNTHTGQNVYGVIHAPRGDGTEAIVLVATWKTIEDELNLNGVTLALTLARYFKRWSLWSKDIIFLITPDSKSGAQAWVDAYHDMHPPSVQPLPLKSGALQGALVFEYPFDYRFESIHIVYDGVNGQLPNLDLFNTAVSVSSGQMGIPATLQKMYKHDDSYKMRLQTMLRGMVNQGLGNAAGAHSSFIPYHIDAITLQTIGTGWQDEMALGRTVESLVRSLNNLLEHFHQSFFFYILMQANRFVSIGTYLPSAMLIAGNFTIMAVALWMKSGVRASASANSDSTTSEKIKSSEQKDMAAAEPEANGILERHMALPLALVFGLHLLGVVPLYTFNNISHQYFEQATNLLTLANLLLPLSLAALLTHFSPTPQQYLLVKSFSLLLLGLFLSALATLNFSLSLMTGLLCTPLSHIGHIQKPTSTQTGPAQGAKKATKALTPVTTIILSVLGLIIMNLISPTTVLLSACHYWQIPVSTLLTEAAFGWNVWGMWTQVVVWCVWWPAWLCGCLLLASSVF
ncbi:rhomboid protein 2 [Helicocarpus griseus UAMH5409]|uniref:Rhomboid protein 2 n=1 Tax=Helicocarpus griseus UAMH5409 TaxID=1447875 RepID=A0A2B7XM42_9EURO|nr:rhomboid protein 2 [Helicocarpus griseus UAMH5409]